MPTLPFLLGFSSLISYQTHIFSPIRFCFLPGISHNLQEPNLFINNQMNIFGFQVERSHMKCSLTILSTCISLCAFCSGNLKDNVIVDCGNSNRCGTFTIHTRRPGDNSQTLLLKCFTWHYILGSLVVEVAQQSNETTKLYSKSMECLFAAGDTQAIGYKKLHLDPRQQKNPADEQKTWRTFCLCSRLRKNILDKICSREIRCFTCLMFIQRMHTIFSL